MHLIYRFVVSALIISFIAWLLPGIKLDSFLSAIAVSVLISIVDVTIKPILKLIIFPLTILTLGLALLVVNTGIILFIDYLVEGFHISSFFTAMIFSILCTLFGATVNTIGD